MPLRRILLAASLALLSAPACAGQRPIVLELFTSQGCSSCPPAEALLGEYARRADVLPLGFHVTYWNRLGWRDTFSFEAATERQNAYARHLGTQSSFTPELVVDGRRSVIGSRRREVADAVFRATGDRADEAALTLAHDKDELTIRVGAGKGSARILLVGFDPNRVTSIGRGENGGRTIAQANVVRSLREIGRWDGTARAFVAARPAGEDAAVLLQASDGRIVGAARLTRE